MHKLRLLAIALLIPFTILTCYASYQVGYMGVLEQQLATAAGWQVWVDLVIAVLLCFVWLIPHAKRTGRNPWPYVLIALVFASLGPLLYLALAKPEHPAPGDL
ncbi:MAG: DUF2834 domain-containing protein [Myxococcota bacterium]